MAIARPGRRETIAGFIGAIAWPHVAVAGTSDDPVSTPIVLEDGRAWVAASINGGKPLLFIIDTGGAFQTIRPEIAAQYRLPVAGGHNLLGLGKDTPRESVVAVHELRFTSGLTQVDAAFSTYAFDAAVPDMAGVLAAGLFTTQDSELDFEAGQWRLWRRGRSDFAGLSRMDARIEDATPGYSTRLIATAVLDGRPLHLFLDTGASGILLNPRAARASGLWDDTRPFSPVATRGYGGLAARPSRLVRAGRLTLGPLDLQHPLVTLMDPGQAGHDRDGQDGLIGLDHLRLLTLATQVRGRALWTKRNGLAPLPERRRMTGVWLERTAGGGARVQVVGTGSPAAAAGMRVGDRVTDPPTFEAALRAISLPEVTLVVASGGGTEPRRWTARPYL